MLNTLQTHLETPQPLGMGCWAIGGPFRDGDGWMGYGQVDDDESLRALCHGLQHGARFLDTADVYGCGHSERIIGAALRHTGLRHQVTLAVKFGYAHDETAREVRGLIPPTEDAVHAALDASLRRLGTDWIDLYLLHPYTFPEEDALHIRDILETLVHQGRIRAYGWCCEDPARLRRFAGPGLAAIPQLASLLGHRPDLLALCDELDLLAIARRPLGMGLLTGKFTPTTILSDADMRLRFRWNLRDGVQAAQCARLERLRPLLTADGRTLAQAALAWHWATHPRLLPIPGFKTVAQVQENLAARPFGPLPPETIRQWQASAP